MPVESNKVQKLLYHNLKADYKYWRFISLCLNLMCALRTIRTQSQWSTFKITLAFSAHFVFEGGKGVNMQFWNNKWIVLYLHGK